MKTSYFGNTGTSLTHSWKPADLKPGFWWVYGKASFTRSGYAVVDDFGNLVEVQA